MNPTDLRRHVAPLFAGSPRRSVSVAVEQELIVFDTGDGWVPIRRVRRLLAGAPWLPAASFEPGGQLELSLPPAADIPTLDHTLRRVLADLGRRLGAGGIRAEPLAWDLRRDVPRQLHSPRYDAMERHLDSIGPAGRAMMRRTASTQLCLDWWPGAAGLEQWRVAHLAAPLLAADFQREPARLAAWLELDPTRTALDDRLLRGDDPVAAYADFAAGATRFVAGGPAEHLTTLFPPVRPRGRYLEFRFADAQEPDGVRRLAEALARLLYDDEVRRATLRRLWPARSDLAERWQRVGAGAAVAA